ncbi:MAG: bifunctional isocitrate dehydrogenase kinase/phosphatase [Gammaproteobacteria bacterium]
MTQARQQQLVAECASAIYDGFLRYNRNFSRITTRAQQRFEQRDWKGHQDDIVERVDLYEKSVRRIVAQLTRLLGPRLHEHALWNDLRWQYGRRIDGMHDAGFMKTFFNSITRRIFDTVGVDPQVEFISPAPDEGFNAIESLRLQRYPCWGSIRQSFTEVLDHFRFQTVYVDREADAAFIAEELDRHYRINLEEYGELLRFDFIDTVFYQSSRAYLIGRIIQDSHISPIILALQNTENGIHVDSVLLSEEEVSIVFSYTRSYFFADPNTVVGAVQFLHSILPRKPIDELYTVLGRLRQGKTERHRTFTRHLNNTDDLFAHAEGDTGLVMLVFTLPSYDLVFKVIRDRFGPPKTIGREDVIRKYRLVSEHDHAGRLIDTQEFLNLEFPADRFSQELMDDLLQETADTVRIDGDKLLFKHVYIERRVRPLNLYLREANRIDAECAILDYGQCIRDLAKTNLFPGDLLLKNFGVTRHRRVVFYDYDEVTRVTDCRFREFPQPQSDDELMHPETWYYVDENDIFPEEFIKFLGMDSDLRKLFIEVHGDLLSAAYWNNLKSRLQSGEVFLVVPYERPAMLNSLRGRQSA